MMSDSTSGAGRIAGDDLLNVQFNHPPLHSAAIRLPRFEINLAQCFDQRKAHDGILLILISSANDLIGNCTLGDYAGIVGLS